MRKDWKKMFGRMQKEDVKKTGIVVMQYPEGVDFGEEKAYLIIGIAGVGDEHLEILGNIVASLEDEELLENLKKDADIDTIIKTFG
jgi:PTS system mannitol-specific IIC component